MSRKNYVAIAAALRRLVEDPNLDRKSITATIDAICAEFHKDNPRFDVRRFYAACGLVS